MASVTEFQQMPANPNEVVDNRSLPVGSESLTGLDAGPVTYFDYTSPEGEFVRIPIPATPRFEAPRQKVVAVAREPSRPLQNDPSQEKEESAAPIHFRTEQPTQQQSSIFKTLKDGITRALFSCSRP